MPLVLDWEWTVMVIYVVKSGSGYTQGKPRGKPRKPGQGEAERGVRWVKGLGVL